MDTNNSQPKNNNIFIIAGAIILAGIFVAGAIIYTKLPPEERNKNNFISNQNNPQFFVEEKNNETNNNEPKLKDIKIDLNGWFSLGSENAKVLIVEYADYACPYCGKFWEETFPQIKKNYIDTGKVRFVYKDLIVVGGEKAAEAAHCAGEQGKYWEYHDLLFSRQMRDRSKWGDSEVHRQYAKELGLNEDQLVKCFESGKYQNKVNESSNEGASNGGQGTPYFLVNNTPIFGAYPYSEFEKVIEAALNK
jgi:protein-disulfide isomerase